MFGGRAVAAFCFFLLFAIDTVSGGDECNGKIVIGAAESVYIPSAKMKMEARIDTGATTTSIDARDIEVLERDGKKWVKFILVDREGNSTAEIEKRVVKIVPIKRHGMEDQKRYAVKMKIMMGDKAQLVLVTLADRSRFDFPVLIGRNFLRGEYLVDVELEHSVKTADGKK